MSDLVSVRIDRPKAPVETPDDQARDKYRVKNKYRDTLSEGSSTGRSPLVTSRGNESVGQAGPATEDDELASLRPSYRPRPRPQTVSESRPQSAGEANPKLSQPLVGIQGQTADEVLGLEGRQDGRLAPLDEAKWSSISEQLQGAGKLGSFEKLDDAQKVQFQTLAQNSLGEDGKVDPSLVELLEGGKLSKSDAKGNSLAENLLALKSQKFGEGIDGEQVYREVLDTVAHPAISNQGTRGTCAGATTQYLSAKSDPAEYVRLMAGLTGTEGKVDLRNGETMSLHRQPQIGAWPEKGGREYRRFTDVAFQDSVLEHANGQELSYNSSWDSDIRKNRNGISTLEPPGLTETNTWGAYNAVLPHTVTSYDYQQDSAASRQQVQQDMQEAFQRGDGVPVSMNWADPGKPHAQHAVAVEKMDNDYVYLRNPHGSLDKGTTAGPPRTIVGDGGLQRITRDEFFSRLLFYDVPGAVNVNGPNPVNLERPTR